jgi:large subunit ribosomal protein L15
LLRKKNGLVKVLGSGEISTAITVHAHKFSKSAQEKIEKAGGKVVLLGGDTIAPKGKLKSKQTRQQQGA